MRKVIVCLQALLDARSSENKNITAGNDLSAFLRNHIFICAEELRKNEEIEQFIKKAAPCLLNEITNPQSEIWNFVLWNSVLLIYLKFSLEKGEDILSIGEQKIIRTSLQFIIRLGVYSSLLPGVGIPLSIRTEFHNWKFSEELSFDKSHRRIMFSLIVIFHLLNHSAFKSLVLAHHLVDILAVCLQICYGPMKKITQPQMKSEDNQSYFAKVLLDPTLDSLESLFAYYNEGLSDIPFDSNELLSEMWADRYALQPKFEDLQKQLYQPLLVRDLLTLQNSAVKRLDITSPKWYKRSCGELLSLALLRQNGVFHVVDGILLNISDFADQEDSIEATKMQYETIGKLLANPPNQLPDLEHYYKIISPQVLLLFDSKSDQNAPVFIACYALINMIKKDSKLAQQLALCPIYEPLSLLCNSDEDQVKDNCDEEHPKVLLIKEEALSKCVMLLNKIFSCGPEITEELIPYLLRPIFFPLITLFTQVNGGISHLQKPLESLLVLFLHHSEDNIDLLNAAAFSNEIIPRDMLKVALDIFFELGESGGLQAFKGNKSEDILESIEQIGASLLRLVSNSTLEILRGNWFLSLLERLSKTICSTIGDDSTTLNENELKDKMTLLLLIQRLSEGDCLSLLKDTTTIITFVSGMLQRSVELCSKSEETFLQESLLMCLTILMLITSQKEHVSDKSWEYLATCLTSLKKLSVDSSDPVVKKLSSDLSIAIATRGVVDIFSQEAPQHKNSTDKSSSKNEFDQAIQELCDTSPATKGHALITLKKLLIKKDPQAVAQRENLFTLFEQHLFNEDSYVYLTAIEALSTVSLTYTDALFPRMLASYARLDEKEQPIEVNLNLGEAIIKVSRNLGDMIPKYRDILLNTFLSGAKHRDHQIRLSSLSNLAEVCKLLKFSFGPNLQEILLCLFSISEYDPNIEVRRSGIMVLTLMLRGLGKHTFSVLQNELLMVYRFLKKLYELEKDDILKLHCQLALEEINETVQEAIRGKAPMEKEIKILNF